MPPRLPRTHLQNPVPRNIFPSPRSQYLYLLRHASQAPAATVPEGDAPKKRGRQTRQRRLLYSWLEGPGKVFKNPLPGSTNYLNAYSRTGKLLRLQQQDDENKQGEKKEGGEGKTEVKDSEEHELEEAQKEMESAAKGKDGKALPKETLEDLRPFPLNRDFRSEAVLSEQLRDAIYDKVMNQKISVREVSAELKVTMDRVGAVVRLKQMERDWASQGKRLAYPYHDAVLSMVPTTPYKPDRPVAHESINDLPVHRATGTQIFYPASESRHFTRVDAGKAFKNNLLPADERIPHPEMITMEKERLAGQSFMDIKARQREREKGEEQRKLERREREAAKEAARTKVVVGKRWDFKFRDFSNADVMRDQRSEKGVGWRYGFPHEDRKKGKVKIPTSVQ